MGTEEVTLEKMMSFLQNKMEEQKTSMEELMQEQGQQSSKFETFTETNRKQFESLRTEMEDQAKRQYLETKQLQQEVQRTKEEIGVDVQSAKEEIKETKKEVQSYKEQTDTEFAAIHEKIKNLELQSNKDLEENLQESALQPSMLTSTPKKEISNTSNASMMASTRKKPQNFDGTVSWEAYIAQFQILARSNGWNDAEKASELSTCLTGRALEVLAHLSETQAQNYESLVRALKQRFGAAHKEELFRSKFRTRTRTVGEPLQELVQDLEKLAHFAYPQASEDLLTVLTRDQFMDALDDTDIQVHVKQAKPSNVQDALGLALEFEAITKTSKSRKKGPPSSGFNTRKANVLGNEYSEDSDDDQKQNEGGQNRNFRRFRNRRFDKSSANKEILENLSSVTESLKKLENRLTVVESRKPVFKPCEYCKKTNHASANCWSKPSASQDNAKPQLN